MVFEEERLTYRELARPGRGPGAAPGGARGRARGGGGRGAERSVELVVGLLGVLGAGGAYLPLEP